MCLTPSESLTASILQNYGGLQNKSLVNIISDDADPEADNTNFMDNSYYYDINSFKNSVINKKNIKNGFSVFSTNIMSIGNSIEYLDTFVASLASFGFKFSVILLQECWLTDASDPRQFNIEGYNMFHYSATCGQKGGLLTYVSSDFESELVNIDLQNPDIWEGLYIKISSKNLVKPVLTANIYRPPRNSGPLFRESLKYTLSNIDRNSHEVFLCGDFNYDLLKLDTDGEISHFFDDVTAFGYNPLITLPTRFNNNRSETDSSENRSATLIDNIFCRSTECTSDAFTGILTKAFSDHLPYFAIFSNLISTKSTRYPRKKITIPGKIDTDKLIQVLRSTDFEKSVEEASHPSDKMSALVNILSTTVSGLFPDRTVNFKRRKHAIKPWVTKGILTSINSKDEMHKELLTLEEGNSKNTLRKYMKLYKSTLKKILRASKKTYFHSLFDNHRDNSRKTWSVINGLLKSKNQAKRQLSDYFYSLDGSSKLYKSEDIANNLNEYFTNIGTNLATNISSTSDGYKSLFPDILVTNSFSFSTVSIQEIEKIIDDLSPKKSSGYDGISTELLKLLKPILLPCIHNIINQCIEQSLFPDSLKIAKVVPLYKGGDKHYCMNYRPISLLPSLSKIFEKIIHVQLYNYFSQNNLINPSQYGYRKGHSTEFALADLVENILDSFHAKNIPLTILLDLSKAFDTIDHKILLWKLEKYGLSRSSLALLANYLSYRFQYVHFDGRSSSMTKLTIGVPQGSILGPLLFLIYLNDIHSASQYFKFILFADDTSLFSTPNLSSTADPSVLALEVDKIRNWLNENKLSLNAKKTKCIVFHHASKKILSPSFKIGEDEVEVVDNYKFLGFYLDNRLNWNVQINQTCKKITKVIGILNRLKNILPWYIKLQIYNSLVACHLNSGLLVWGNMNNLDRILKLQKKAMRIILNKSYNSHTDPLFKRLGVLKITDMLIIAKIKFFYKFKEKTLPTGLQSITMAQNSNIHNHFTRGCNNFHRTRCHSKSLKCMLEICLDVFPNCTVEFLERNYSLPTIIQNFKTFILDSYSNIEVCSVRNCYSCK